MSNSSTKRIGTERPALSCYCFGGLSLPLLLVGCAIALLLCFGVVPSYAYKLPDTGQTKCYNESGTEISCAGTGQDGEYSINPKSYTDNGNGTVTDNNTGLMWQKCSAGQNNDATCSGTATTKSWADADAYCTNLRTGGYSDWRLPTKKELITLVDYGIPYPGPTINTTYFPNTRPSYYWSSTTDAYDTLNAWYVDFNYGYVYYYDKTYGHYVRCVRAGQSGSLGNFIDNANGTVTDTKTGLMWQKCSAGQNNDATCSGTTTSYTWQNALNYCNILALGGYDDWRLPNAIELESITDDTRYNPAIDTNYFPNTQSSDYWSSTTNATYAGRAWFVYFNGYVSHYYKTDSYYVRCVRDGLGGSLPTRDPIFRFYNTYTGGHFFTDNPDERDYVRRELPVFRWESDGAYYIYRTQQSGTSPVYRLFNTYGVGHYYTISGSDKDAKVAQGYALERVGFYAFTTQVSGTKPVYYFNRPASTNNGKEAWFYTISEAEKDLIITTMPVWV